MLGDFTLDMNEISVGFNTYDVNSSKDTIHDIRCLTLFWTGSGYLYIGQGAKSPPG